MTVLIVQRITVTAMVVGITAMVTSTVANEEATEAHPVEHIGTDTSLVQTVGKSILGHKAIINSGKDSKLSNEIVELKIKLSELKNTKKCPDCGANISKNSAYCNVCGSKII